MSARYVYAILGRDVNLSPGVAGIDGAELTLVPYRDLTAVVSVVEPARVERTVSSALQHEEVVEALRQSGPLLPARLGTILPDSGAVARALAHQYDALRSDLFRLGDKVEFGLTLLWRAPVPAGDEAVHAVTTAPGLQMPDPAKGTGMRYMRERLAERRREASLQEKARALSGAVNSALQPYVLDQRSVVAPNPRIAVRAAYLLLPSAVSDFEMAFDKVRTAHPELRFLLSGPWPPYSFVSVQAQTDPSSTSDRVVVAADGGPGGLKS